jgi:hypothetical protein
MRLAYITLKSGVAGYPDAAGLEHPIEIQNVVCEHQGAIHEPYTPGGSTEARYRTDRQGVEQTGDSGSLSDQPHGRDGEPQTPSPGHSGNERSSTGKKPHGWVSYDTIAEMWMDGRSTAEIANATGYVNIGNKDRYHTLRKILHHMHKGYWNSKGELAKLPYRFPPKAKPLADDACTSTQDSPDSPTV